MLYARRMQVSLQPRQHVMHEEPRLFEFQSVMGPAIFNDLFIFGGQALDEGTRLGVDDDAVVLGQEQEHRRMDIFGNEAQIAVEPNALDEEAGRRLLEPKGIVAEEVEPARRGGEQLRIAERDREQLARTKQPRQ